MLIDGTLRQLRESQWFRNMRAQVQASGLQGPDRPAEVVSAHADLPLLKVPGGTYDKKHWHDGAKEGLEQDHEDTWCPH